VLSPRLAQRPRHRDVAALHAGEALALARKQGSRGSEATTLRLMGDITSADRAEAEGYFRGALALATQLGMCPLCLPLPYQPQPAPSPKWRPVTSIGTSHYDHLEGGGEGARLVLCLQCRFGNRASVSFCEECGARLEVACPSCGAVVPPGRKFCGTCGHALTARAEPAPKFVRAAMRLNLMEPTPGLSSGGARSEIRTLPVRGPPCPTPNDTRG